MFLDSGFGCPSLESRPGTASSGAGSADIFRGSILGTTNLTFDEWTEVFGSERLTGALLDRLTHHVHILEMNGDSYRLRHSRQNAASQVSDDPETPDSLPNCGPLLLMHPRPVPCLLLSHRAGGTRFLRRGGPPSRRP